MRTYYEALEKTTSIADTPDSIRIDVTEMDEAEREQVKADIVAVMEGKDYILRKHDCRHDEEKGCQVSAL